jgi:hypothetical protein
MIVQYYSDSLGLARPGIVKMSQRYIYLFQEWLKDNIDEDVFVIDRAKGGATIDKLFTAFGEDESYIDEAKDILIIHAGICDCAPRPVPLRLRNIISRLPAFLRIRVVNYLHRNRARLIKSGFIYYNTDKEKFGQILSSWLSQAVNNFRRIYVINIAPTNEETENHSPGFQRSISVYNEIIESVVNKTDNSKIILIEINQVISKSDQSLDDLISKKDGHHLTSLAHMIYANELIRREEKLKPLHV